MLSIKEHGRTFLKVAVGFGLVYYVLQTNMVDFEQLSTVVFNPFNLFLAFAFLILSAVLVAVRWHQLMIAQGLSVTLKDSFGLTMIGIFFNTFMPGAVGGDLIKAWYVAGREPTRKTRAIFTVILDRVIGLNVILSYAAVTLALQSSWMQGRPELQALGIALWCILTGTIVFVVAFFLTGKREMRFAEWLISLLNRFTATRKVVEAGLLYRERLGTILFSILCSAFSISSTVVLWSLQGKAMGIELSMAQYFFIVPVGLTVSAIPLLPGGIGVGQVAFFTLFQWMGIENPEQGGTLCTLMQIYTILFNCMGAFFYIRYKSGRTTPVKKTTPNSQPGLSRAAL